jgi:hypothetical protein
MSESILSLVILNAIYTLCYLDILFMVSCEKTDNIELHVE